MKAVYRTVRDQPSPLNPLSGEPGRYGWLHFVGRSGEEGRRWAAAFRRPEHVEILRAAAGSLARLHQRDTAAGRDLLLRMEEGIQGLDGISPSVRFALEAVRHPLRAYYHYALGELETAAEHLDRADEAVAAAVSQERVLLPLTQHGSEFRLHRARIERNRRRWDEMHRYIAETREMMEERRPLCHLADGTPVTLGTLQDFHAAIPGLTDSEQTFLRGLFDRELRLRLFERFVARICTQPGFVIP